MFKESGSTIPDNESSHERMVEQALRSKSFKAASSPGLKLVESDEMPKSSSFPWSASEQTEVARSHTGRDKQAAAPESGTCNTIISPPHAQKSAHVEDNTNPALVDGDYAIPGPATAVMVAPMIPNEPHRSSPTVHITPVEKNVPSVAQRDAVPAGKTQKAGRGRKRKVQEESSEPLNSDDIAVGLPKERYIPRPSRRRASEAFEEQIDYSVVPEKAAKIKRSKTMGSSTDSADTQSHSAGKQTAPGVERRTKSAKDSGAAEPAISTARSIANDPPSQTSAQLSKPSPVVEVPAKVGTPPPGPEETIPHGVAQATEDNKAMIRKDDLDFAKPAPKKKTAPKSKRSSTTIFEDHVEFTGKSKSPSLSQQQAIRQSALMDVKNEATPVKRKRAGKAVIPDDDDVDDKDEEDIPRKPKSTRKAMRPDDDEDELAYDPNSRDEEVNEPPDEPPRKRGRGRPPKSASKADPEVTAKSTKRDAHEGVDANVQAAPEEPAKKRRGRPPKSAASVPSVDENKGADDISNDQIGQHEGETPVEKSIENLAAESTPAKQNSAKKIPTPSPEKQPSVETKVASDKMVKASPAAHSPIKSSSPAPYRVGLSKKHRIPSLLRVMRPPPSKLPSKKK